MVQNFLVKKLGMFLALIKHFELQSCNLLKLKNHVKVRNGI